MDKAVSLAQAVEIAEKGSKDLHAPPMGQITATPDVDLFKLNPGVPKKVEDKTFDTSKNVIIVVVNTWHPSVVSNLRNVTYICHKRRHIARVCQSRSQNKKAQTTRNSQPVNNITDTSLDSEYQLYVVSTQQ